VVWESAVSSKVFNRQREDSMLISLSGAMVVVSALFLLLRFGDIVVSGKTGLMFSSGMLSVMFWIEMALVVIPMLMLMRAKDRANFVTIFKASVLELLITLGVVAFEIFLYIVIVKRYPILSGTRAAQVREIEGRA